MKTKQIALTLLLIISMNSFAQDAKKMSKNLKVTTTEKYNKTATISFDRKNPDKHGFEDISAMFKNAFVTKKFTIKDNPQYLLIMDYGYLYSIPRYRMQYSDFTAEIIDLNNNKTVVATIVYNGKFEIDAIAEAVATELDKTLVPTNSSTTKTGTPNTPPSKSEPKTKEEKLVELKQLYEKQLITKEEYEAEKKKILAE